MVYMLFDNPADKQNMTFLNGYEAAKIRQVYPQQKCNSVKEMLAVCKDMIKQSAEGDTIICWYDFMAVLCWWLCKVQLKNRKIIALNILLKDKATAKNKLAKFLYKPMLKSKKVQATVTSEKYGKHLNEMFGIQKQYIVLHDIYHGDYSINYEGKVVPNTVFCGGRNGRDWNFLIKLAQAMPEVTFNCVMSKDKFEQYKKNFCKNMVVKSDIIDDCTYNYRIRPDSLIHRVSLPTEQKYVWDHFVQYFHRINQEYILQINPVFCSYAWNLGLLNRIQSNIIENKSIVDLVDSTEASKVIKNVKLANKKDKIFLCCLKNRQYLIIKCLVKMKYFILKKCMPLYRAIKKILTS